MQKVGQYRLAALVIGNTEAVHNQTYSVTPGPFDPLATTLSSPPSNSSITAGQPLLYRVQPRDQYGNPTSLTEGAHLNLTITGVSVEASQPSGGALSLEDNSVPAGPWVRTQQLVVAGVYTTRLTYSGQDGAQVLAEVQVIVKPGAASPLRSSLQIPDKVTAGQHNVKVVLFLRDSYDNALRTTSDLTATADLRLNVAQQSSYGIEHDLMKGTFSQLLCITNSSTSGGTSFVPNLGEDSSSNITGASDARVSAGEFDMTAPSTALAWNVSLVQAGTYTLGVQLGMLPVAGSAHALRVSAGPLNVTASRLQGLPSGSLIAGVYLSAQTHTFL
jgi:hypothetical protein